MADDISIAGPIAAVALLDEPNRQRLYDLVAASRGPVGRDDAAAALGMSRELAAFHLDRLADAGLLQTEYRRRNGRSGPGAGRPAKFYQRTDRDVAVALPPRRYDVAADVFADALARLDGPSATDAVAAVARERGVDAGAEARQSLGPRPSRRRLRAALLALLGRVGFEPQVDATTEAVSLRNCPYRALASDHRQLTCGMNLAWAEGVIDGLAGSKLGAERDPRADGCCVVFRAARGGRRTGMAAG